MKYLLSLLLILGTVVSCTKKTNFKEKVLNVVVEAKVKGFDPINSSDSYSSREIARVYEGLLTFHYLKRPYVLTPNLAQEMPKASNNNLTYTFKLRKGILFHDNKCFPNGKGREFVAEDVIYSIKRLADAKNNASGWWLLDGKIKGLNKWRKEGKSDYSKSIAGLVVKDKYTVEFNLTKPSPQFLYAFAMVNTFVVAKEAVDFYGQDFINNPVGTGAFKTTAYKQGSRIEYLKNPSFRDMFYPSEGSDDDKEAGLLKDAGKKLPLVDKIVAHVQVEAQPRWLSFDKGKLDFVKVPKDQYESVVTPGKDVANEYAKKGVSLIITPDLDFTYIAFNHDDPLFKNVKLKQAMMLAYDGSKSLELFYNGRGIPAQTVIPPGIGGYDPNYKNPFQAYDLEKAKKLLVEAGYPKGEGLPELNYDTNNSTVQKQMGDFFKKHMADIGIKVKVNVNTWPQLVQKVKTRQVQLFAMSWIADYPDAENFLQLLYGPNSSPGPNGSNYNVKDFNKSFDTAVQLNNESERAKLYAKMAQETAENIPYILGIHRTSFVVTNPWLKNYKYSSFEHGNAIYYTVDLKDKKNRLQK